MTDINFQNSNNEKLTLNDISFFCNVLYLPHTTILLDYDSSPFEYSIIEKDNKKMKTIYFKDYFVALFDEESKNVLFKDQNAAILIKQFIISHLGHIHYLYPTI